MGRAGTRWRVLAASVLVAMGLNAVPAAAQDDEGPPPPTTTKVTGPIGAVGAHGRPLMAAAPPLDAVGYVEQEVFLEGTATVYGPQGLWGQDGRWAVTEMTEEPYRTRLIVRRPADPARFNGTVVVDWLNVGPGFDFDPVWVQLGAELVREGAAYVGVSAQSLGVEGDLGARRWDPQRYGSLILPGDNLSYDIFSQAGAVLRAPKSVDPLAGLSAERRLIAAGASQSAQRLVTYINAFHQAADVYEGFLVLARFRGAAPLGNAGVPSTAEIDPDDEDPGVALLSDPVDALLSGPPRAEIRSDTDVPVFVVLTETEAPQNTSVSRDDSDRYRTWEVAGASHIDATITQGISDQAGRDFPDLDLSPLACAQPNELPTRYALRAAMRALAAWVDDGTAPPRAPRLGRDGSGRLKRDADGNAVGGVRLPEIEVPTAAYSGVSDASGYCGLTGSTVPFPTEELAERYPDPEAYASALAEAADEAVDKGYLLPEDAAEIVATATDALATATVDAVTAEEEAAADTKVGVPGARVGAAGPTRGAEAAEAGAGSSAASPEAAKAESSEDRGWMATTGRDLITPVLVGLLLLVNGRVVLTIANQRRRRSG
jgi:hypothetical protein